MSWRTGIAVLSFFALVSVIQYPRVVEFIQELSEPDTTIAVPDPVIVAPGTPTSELGDSGETTTRAVAKDDLTIEDLKLLALEYINEEGMNALAMLFCGLKNKHRGPGEFTPGCEMFGSSK